MNCRRHRAVSLLLGYEPALLDYLFTPARTRLRLGARTLRREAQLLGPVRHLLVKLAMDIWNSKGGARLPDICQLLPPHHFDGFIVAMEYLGATAALGCGCPHCRVSELTAASRTSSQPRGSARLTPPKGEVRAEASTSSLRPVRG